MSQLHRLRLFALWGLLLAAAACSINGEYPKPQPQLQSGPQKGTVEGQITPAHSITAVTALFEGVAVATTTPNTTGNYSLSLPGGTYTLRFTRASCFTSGLPDRQVNVFPGTVTGPVSYTITSERLLGGKIDPANAIANVTAIDACGVGVGTTPTATGDYSFSSLPFGTYTLRFTPAPGFAAPPDRQGAEIVGTSRVNFGPILMGTTYVYATQPGTVRGEITPANAIANVTALNAQGVTAATATPSAAGGYSLSLPGGTYTLRFTPTPGFTAPASERVSVSAGGVTGPVLTYVTQSGGTATLSVSNSAQVVSLVRARLLPSGLLTVTMETNSGEAVKLEVNPYVNNTVFTGNFNSGAWLEYYYLTNSSTRYITGINTTGAFCTITPVGSNPSRISGSFSTTVIQLPSLINPTPISGTFTNVAY